MQIALVGSAPASIRLAPYHDPNWRIFGCSPGVYGVAPRVDEWFELHLWEPGAPWFSPEYCQWLKALPNRGVRLWTGRDIPDIPGSSVLPAESILEEFDPNRWFCTSSLFWMMAIAIRQIEEQRKKEDRSPNEKQDKIGFWGVDMAATEEYQGQRAGIHFMAYEARNRGIEVGAPHESDLFTPRFRYGVDEWTHAFRKMRARKFELEQRRIAAANEVASKTAEMHFLQGALDDLTYCGDTWADRADYLGPK